MKQYCRYCAYMCCGNGNWCSAKQKEYSDWTIRTANKCELYEYVPVDAITLKEHKERAPKHDGDPRQVTLIEWIERIEKEPD